MFATQHKRTKAKGVPSEIYIYIYIERERDPASYLPFESLVSQFLVVFLPVLQRPESPFPLLASFSDPKKWGGGGVVFLLGGIGASELPRVGSHLHPVLSKIYLCIYIYICEPPLDSSPSGSPGSSQNATWAPLTRAASRRKARRGEGSSCPLAPAWQDSLGILYVPCFGKKTSFGGCLQKNTNKTKSNLALRRNWLNMSAKKLMFGTTESRGPLGNTVSRLKMVGSLHLEQRKVA